jgi:hypothetical protein
MAKTRSGKQSPVREIRHLPDVSESGDGPHPHRRLVTNAAEGSQVRERLPGAEVNFFTLMSHEPDLADKAGELLPLINGDGHGLNAVPGDEHIAGAPIEPAFGQAQHGRGERFPNPQRAAKDVDRQGQRQMAWSLLEGGRRKEAQPNLTAGLAESQLRPTGAGHGLHVGDGKFLAANVARPSLTGEPFAGALEEGCRAVSQGREAKSGQMASVIVEGDEGERPRRGMFVQPIGFRPVSLAGDVEEETVQAAGVDGTAVNRFT